MAVLIAAGADVNASGEGGQTPLFSAVIGRSTAVVEQLLAAGASPHIRDAFGYTPLRFARGLGGNDLPAPDELIAALERCAYLPESDVIPDALQDQIKQLIGERLPELTERISFELQENGRFLLITLSCGPALPSTEELRRQIGRGVDALLPGRPGALTWMLNFVVEGIVEDSYFGGDSESPQPGC